MHCPFCRHTDSRVIDSPHDRRRHGDPPAPPVPGVQPPLHHAGDREPQRDQARRGDRAVQPGQGPRRACARPARGARSARTTWRCSPSRSRRRIRAAGQRRDRGARGRPGDPRTAARARRGRLPAVRQRLPGVRHASRTSRRRSRCCGPSGRPPASSRRPSRTPDGARRASPAPPSTPAPPTSQHEPRGTGGTVSAPRRHLQPAAEPRSGRRTHMTETTGARAGAREGQPGKGVKVERIYTTPGVHPYDEVTWERRDVVQQNWKTGETIFEQRGVEFPDFWSVNASTIVTTKYFRGAVGTAARETGAQAAHRPRRPDLRQGRQGARLLRHARGRRDLRARADLGAAAPGVQLQLARCGSTSARPPRSRSAPASSSPSTTRWTRSSTGTRRRASSSRAAPAPA